MANILPSLLDYNLRVVFVGTEPGPESIEHYYSNSTNVFYCTLFEAGWTSKLYTPSEDKLLLSEGIGLDDVYDDPEFLLKRLEKFKPKVVCFNSKEALHLYSRKEIDNPWTGKQASRFVNFPWNPIVWALTDSSSKAQKLWHVRTKCLKELLEITKSK